MSMFQSDDFHVVEKNDGKGRCLFASRPFAKGEAIFPFDYWSLETMPIHVTNHSCDPNGRFDDGGMLIALRDIARDEEITFDYIRHPIPGSPWNFKCRCDTVACTGWVVATRY